MPQQNIKQIKGATQGSVLFLGTNGVVSENNRQLFWNTTSNALLIGTTSLFGAEKFRVIGDQRIDGNLVVTGSFSVLGSASIINTTNLVVSDPIIMLAASQSGSPTLDSGLFINRGTGATQAFIWDESVDEFAFVQTNDNATVIGNVTIASYANIRANGATLSQIKITNGSSNNFVLTSDATGFGTWTSPATVVSNASGVTGSGTINYVPKWTNTSNLGDSIITSSSVNVGINVINPNATLDIAGATHNNYPIRMISSNTSLSRAVLLNTGRVQADLQIGNNNGSNSIYLGLFNNSVPYLDNRTGQSFVYQIVGSTKLTIDTDGRLGINATPTTLLHIGATQAGTGFRLVDTTQQSGYVLTSDANGVGTWQPVSIGVTVSNGLTYSGGNIKLGGVLTEPTLITNGNRSFTMSTTNVIEFYKNLGGTTYSHILNNTGALVRAITSTGHNLLNVDDSSARIEIKDTVSGASFSNIKIFNYDQSTDDALADPSSNNRMVVQDDYYRKGLIYKGDYSSQFTNNSLVTKAYVLSVISSTGSGTTNYGARWVTSTQLGTGSIYDSGTAVGIATQSDSAYALNVAGDVNILGTLYATSKSFEITHPLDSTKRLTYGSLEGPEYGVYYRGKLDNENIINLPDYWTALVDESTISVNITPIGMYQRLFVDRIEDNKVYIGSDNSGSPKCYYIVYAERKDIPKIIIEK